MFGACAIGFTIAGVMCLAAAISIAAFNAPPHPPTNDAKNDRSSVASALGAAQVQDTPLVSTGCGRAAPFASGTSQIERLSSGGLSRAYLLHIPRGYQSRHAYPLLLGFHGTGATAAVMQGMTGFSPLADRAGFVVAYPQGVIGPNGRTGWSSGGRGHPTINDTLFVSDVLDAIQARLCIDPRRIYATGFSNGGGMTWKLSCQLARRIAAFASVSGSYYPPRPSCAPGRAVPVLEIHGTGDGVVPYAGNRSVGMASVASWLSAWVQRDACAAQPTTTRLNPRVTVMRWAGCQGGVAVVHVRIAGGQHVWPSHAVPGGASAYIWSFLSAYTLPGAAPIATR